jgi:hypothetical protein
MWIGKHKTRVSMITQFWDSNRHNHEMWYTGFSLLHLIFYPEVERLKASAVVGRAVDSVYKNS